MLMACEELSIIQGLEYTAAIPFLASLEAQGQPKWEIPAC